MILQFVKKKLSPYIVKLKFPLLKQVQDKDQLPGDKDAKIINK